VRKFYQRTLVMLQKPARRLSLDETKLPLFLDMLAEPYPLEHNAYIRVQVVSPVTTTVTTADNKVVMNFSPPTDIIALDPSGITSLVLQLKAAKAVTSAVAASPV